MIKVVAKHAVKEDMIEKALELFGELVKESRKEENCIKYELYQDSENDSVMTMIEEWENKESLEKHFNTSHFTKLVPEIGKLLEGGAEISVYKKVI